MADCKGNVWSWLGVMDVCCNPAGIQLEVRAERRFGGQLGLSSKCRETGWGRKQRGETTEAGGGRAQTVGKKSELSQG